MSAFGPKRTSTAALHMSAMTQSGHALPLVCGTHWAERDWVCRLNKGLLDSESLGSSKPARRRSSLRIRRPLLCVVDLEKGPLMDQGS
jgi:hypothetical protein